MAKKLFLLCLVAFVLLPALPQGQAKEKATFTNSTPFNPVENLPAMAALEKGFWKQEGLDVNWVTFKSGGPHMQALAAGKSDMGMTGGVSLMRPMAKGVPVIGIADLKALQNFYFWVKADSPINKAQDLKGKKVGISRTGGLGHAYAQVVLRALGLESQTKLVATGRLTASIAALKSGVVDAVVYTPMAMGIPKYQGVAREVVSVRDFMPKPWVDLIVFTSKGLIAKDPGTVNKLLSGYLKAVGFISKNRAWAIQKMKEKFRYPDPLAAEVFDRIMKNYKSKRGEVKVDPRALANVRSFMIEYGLLDKNAPEVEKMYTNQFAK
ncbi:MAG: ABC transporter substrate-binding protein [Thermodesulfobacteriota bacterium]